MLKAVFLDRDGVINQDTSYVHKISDFHFLPGVFQACRDINRAGFVIIIVTNQAGIGRGLYTEEDFSVLCEWMLDCFKSENIEITNIYHCPHHPVHGLGDYKVECDCRKPNPGMLKRAIRDHNIDPKRSYLIGDKLSDIQAGMLAELNHCYLVKSSQPSKSQKSLKVYDDLVSATQHMLSKTQS